MKTGRTHTQSDNFVQKLWVWVFGFFCSNFLTKAQKRMQYQLWQSRIRTTITTATETAMRCQWWWRQAGEKNVLQMGNNSKCITISNWINFYSEYGKMCVCMEGKRRGIYKERNWKSNPNTYKHTKSIPLCVCNNKTMWLQFICMLLLTVCIQEQNVCICV